MLFLIENKNITICFSLSMEEALLHLTTSQSLSTAVEWVDPLRTFPFRFLGFGAAFGEALRGQLPEDVSDVCYKSTTAFVFSHVAFSGYCAITNGDNVFVKVLETAIFDSIATVFLPMVVGSRVRRLVKDIIRRRDPDTPPEVVNFVPSAAACSAVVLLAYPIDTVTNYVLNSISSSIFYQTDRTAIENVSGPIDIPLPPEAVAPITLPALEQQKPALEEKKPALEQKKPAFERKKPCDRKMTMPALEQKKSCDQKKSFPVIIAPITFPLKQNKPAQKKEGISVVITGEPGYQFDFNIKGRRGAPLEPETTAAPTAPQKSNSNETDSETPPNSTKNQQQKVSEPEESPKVAELPKNKSFESRSASASSPGCPRMFKNIKINLSSKSPLRAIYRDPYEDEEDERSSRSGKRKRKSYVNSFGCEGAEMETFDCPPSHSSAVQRSSWNYEASHYCKSADARQNTCASYSDRHFD